MLPFKSIKANNETHILPERDVWLTIQMYAVFRVYECQLPGQTVQPGSAGQVQARPYQ